MCARARLPVCVWANLGVGRIGHGGGGCAELRRDASQPLRGRPLVRVLLPPLPRTPLRRAAQRPPPPSAREGGGKGEEGVRNQSGKAGSLHECGGARRASAMMGGAAAMPPWTGRLGIAEPIRFGFVDVVYGIIE